MLCNSNNQNQRREGEIERRRWGRGREGVLAAVGRLENIEGSNKDEGKDDGDGAEREGD